MSKASQDPKTALLSELFPFKPGRSEKSIMTIVEGAIRSYASHGIDGTTYATIAKAAKVSRPLVQHYFKEKEEIFDLAVKYIRINFQQHVVTAITAEKTPQKMLEAYVESSFSWIEKFPNHARVWILFYFQCTIDKKAKQLHTAVAAAGHARITALLKGGTAAGVFQCSDAEGSAKLIQTVITGGIVTIGTETIDGPVYRQAVLQQCFHLAGLRG